MTPELRRLEIMLICEICEGEVDIHEEAGTGQCRHCGIAFLVDAPASRRSRRSA